MANYWNYRFVRKEYPSGVEYDLHRVYYNTDGSITWVEEYPSHITIKGDYAEGSKSIEEFTARVKEALSVPPINREAKL